MSKAAQAEIGAVEMIAIADRGYFEGEQIRACAEAGIIPMVPKTNTSPLPSRRAALEALCQGGGRQADKCVVQPEGLQCLRNPSAVHDRQGEAHPAMGAQSVLDEMERSFETMPDAMAVRRCTVEHVFGTIKGWMGAIHFRSRGLKNVFTEASPAILAYRIKRTIAVAGVASSLKAIAG